MKQHVIPVFSSVKTIQKLVDVNKMGANVNVSNPIQLLTSEENVGAGIIDRFEDTDGDVNFIVADTEENAKKMCALLDSIGISAEEPITMQSKNYSSDLLSGGRELTIDNVDEILTVLKENSQGISYYRSLDMIARTKEALDHDDMFQDLSPEIITADGTYLNALMPPGYHSFSIYYAACTPEMLAEGGSPHDLLDSDPEELIDYDTLFPALRLDIATEAGNSGQVGVSLDRDGSFLAVFNPIAASMIEGMRPGLVTIIQVDTDNVGEDGEELITAGSWIVNHNGFDAVPATKAEDFYANNEVNTILLGEDTVFVETQDLEASKYPFLTQVFNSHVSANIIEALVEVITDEDE